MAANADVVVAIINTVTPTTGPQTIDYTTTDLGGKTPKAALLICTEATADSTTPSAGLSMSVGACTDIDNLWTNVAWDRNAVGTTVNRNKLWWSAFDDLIVDLQDSDLLGGATYGKFNSWVTNGIKIDWSVTATPGARRLTIILFAGDDVSAKVGNIELSTEDTGVDVTDVGFEPDLVFGCMGRQNNQNDFWMSLGFAKNPGDSGSAIQRTMVAHGVNNSGQSRCSFATNDSYFGGRLANATSLDYAVDLSDFDGSGFTATGRLFDTSLLDVVYLALKFGGTTPPQVYVGNDVMASGTGDKSYTGPGFKPQFVLLGACLEVIDGAGRAGPEAYTFSLGGFTPDDQFVGSWMGEDNQGTTDTANAYSSADCLLVYDDDQGGGNEASFVSMDANGWTVNYSVSNDAGCVLALAIEEISLVTPIELSATPAVMTLLGYTPTWVTTPSGVVVVKDVIGIGIIPFKR